MKCSARVLIFVVSLAAYGPLPSADADVSFRAVVLTDSAVPGAGSGAKFQLFFNAGIGGGGDVIVEGVLKNGAGNVDLSNDTGIWHLPRVGMIAREGAPAPLLPNTTFSNLDIAAGTDSLAVVYKGRLAEEEGAVTFKNDDGIWRWSPEGVRLVAREGDPVPGLNGAIFEGEFSPLGEEAAVNAQGMIAFTHYMDLINEPREAEIDEALWIGDETATTIVAREGDLAPGVPDEAIFRSANQFVLFHSLRLNDVGDLLFVSELSSPLTAYAGNGLFLRDGTTGTTTAIAFTDREAPGTAPQTVFESFDSGATINNDQRLAFAAKLKPDLNKGDAREENDFGIWTGKAGNLQLIAREGDRAPGTPDRVVFDRFDAIGMNDSGMIIFRSSLRDPDNILINNSNRFGIWFWSPVSEQIELVLRMGDAPPGSPDRKFAHPWNMVINDQGLVVLLVESDLPGESLSRRPGAYAWQSGRGLTRLLEGGNIQRQGGDFIEVGPGDTRQVGGFSVTTASGSSMSDGQRRILSNRSELVLPIDFVDATSGLIVVKYEAPLFQPTNPDWKAPMLTRANTAEAELEVRVGDIDNLGFGWPAGYDPFSGVSTPSHLWPWEHESNDPVGTDRIMVVSSHLHSPIRDGYSTYVNRRTTENLPKPIVLSYDASGINVTSARLQVFVDDFQATLGQASYQVTINGARAPFVEEAINRINQTGPVGKLIDLEVPTAFLPVVASGRLSLLFDDPISGIGEGYAIDFVRLLVNPDGGTTTPVIRTVLREGFDTLNDGFIDGQSGWTSSGTGNTIRVTLDSTSMLGGRVVDGLDDPRSAGGPWEFSYATHPIDLAGTGDDVVTLTFDAYAVLNSGGLPSHDSGAGLFASSQPASTGFGFVGTSWWFHRLLGGWQFDARLGIPNSENIETIEGGFDAPVSLSIVVDKLNLKLWGRYDFGNGNSGETTRFSVTRAQVDALDLVELTQDFRFAASRGIEIDNILVTAGPSTPITHRPEITDIWLSGEERDEVKIRWVTEPGVSYRVERSDNLFDWITAIEDIPGNGAPVIVTGKIPLVGRQQYYKVAGSAVPVP